MSCNHKYDFCNKVAVITRACSGIGHGVAKQLALYGAQVTITGRNGDELAQVARGIKAATGREPLQIVGALTDPGMTKKVIEETVKKFGQLDYLINNAADAIDDPCLQSEKVLTDFDCLMKLNVRAPLELIHFAVSYLEKTRGNVLNIGSIAPRQPQLLIYGMTKAALDMLTKNCARMLAGKGIRVNSITPGPVKTDSPCVPASVQSKESDAGKFTALNYMATPQDIANLASFLLSEDARNITGSIMVSDAGALVAAKHSILETKKQ